MANLQTVDDIIRRTRMISFMNAVEPTEILQLINEVHKELCGMFPLQRLTFQVPLTQGVKSYTLGTGVEVVDKAQYVYGSGAQAMRTLEATHYDRVRNFEPWRIEDTTQSEPTEYYVDSGSLTLVEAPPTTTVVLTNIPRVDYDAYVFTALTAGASISSQLKDGQVYVSGVAAKFLSVAWGNCTDDKALAVRQAQLQHFTREYEGELNRISIDLTGMALDYDFRLEPKQSIFPAVR